MITDYSFGPFFPIVSFPHGLISLSISSYYSCGLLPFLFIRTYFFLPRNFEIHFSVDILKYAEFAISLQFVTSVFKHCHTFDLLKWLHFDHSLLKLSSAENLRCPAYFRNFAWKIIWWELRNKTWPPNFYSLLLDTRRYDEDDYCAQSVDQIVCQISCAVHDITILSWSKALRLISFYQTNLKHSLK